MRKKSGRGISSIFDACRIKRETSLARVQRAAVVVRALANEMGAKAENTKGWWLLSCPYCENTICIRERDTGLGYAFTVGQNNCAAATEFNKRVRARL